jgi:hypothetical protein
MTNGAITGRIEELRKPIIEAVGITLESHLKDLMTLRNLAVKNNQIHAAITAEIARGKASGVSTDRVEVTGAGGSPLQFSLIKRVVVEA